MRLNEGFVRRGAHRRERGQMERVIVEAQHRGREAADQALCPIAMASNTGCKSDGEAGDDLKNVGGGGLSLQSLLGLVEQPGVLDRDHRLIGEGLNQRNLARRERLDMVAPQGEHADRRVRPASSARRAIDAVPALAICRREEYSGSFSTSTTWIVRPSRRGAPGHRAAAGRAVMGLLRT